VGLYVFHGGPLLLLKFPDKGGGLFAFRDTPSSDFSQRYLLRVRGQGIKGSANLHEVKEPIRTASEVAAKIGSTSTSGTQKNPPGKIPEGFFCSFVQFYVFTE